MSSSAEIKESITSISSINSSLVIRYSGKRKYGISSRT